MNLKPNGHVNNNKQSVLLVLVCQAQLEVMDALSVVTQLRDLASEPQNRAVIVQDEGCLPGLVLFLDHQSHDVLLATLQVRKQKLNPLPNTHNEVHLMSHLGFCCNVLIN